MADTSDAEFLHTKVRPFTIRLVASVVLVNLFVYLIVGLSLYQIRRQHEQNTAFSTQNLAQSVEHSVSGIFSKIDVTLFSIENEVEQQFTHGIGSSVSFNAYLQNLQTQLPEVVSLSVTDAEGNVLNSTNLPLQKRINLADREYFQRLRGAPQSGMVLSNQVVSRINNVPAIVLARRFNYGDGRFMGVAVASVSIDYFNKIFSEFNIGKHGAIGIRDLDLSLIALYPKSPETGSQPGSRVVARMTEDMIRTSPQAGTYTVIYSRDNIERTLSYRKAAKYPIYIFVGQATRDYLAPWYRESGLAIALAVLFSLLSLRSARLTYRRRLEEIRATGVIRQKEERLRLQTAQLEQELAERQSAQEALQKQAVILQEEVAERRKAEEALRMEQEFSQLLVQSSPVFLVAIGKDGRVLMMNDSMLQKLGYRREEVLGRDYLTTFVPEEDRGELVGIFKSLIEYSKPEYSHINRVLAKDGQVMTCEWRGTPVFKGSYDFFLGAGIDISERRKLEEQLHQSQKLESIGRLAGGVAHDFNNMLSVILGAAQLAMPKVPAGGELWKLLDAITAAAVRSSGITRQLLAFSRKEAIVPRAIDLNAHIAEDQKHLVRLIGEDVKLSFHPAAEPCMIKMDPSQLDQVLMNLSVNARDAMQGGGSLIMETFTMHLDSDHSHFLPDAQPGDYVLLTVSDTGCGMDRETRSRIFEPFFTTKELGRGTGLGLSTVYGIVTQNGGFINCYSEPGEGTTFRVYLPRLLDSGVEEQEAPPPAMTGTETILLVEDEEILINIASKMLEQLGYTVIPAESPRAAISICGQRNLTIDLILTDVIMPEMNGKEMIDKIKLIRPGIKVIFMSGYAADIVAQRGILEEGMNYLQKPLDQGPLQEKLRKVLGGGGAQQSAGAQPDTLLPESLTDDEEVIDLFMAKAPGYLSQIQAGLGEGDLDKMQFFSHKLKGAAAALGCHSLSALAGELEELSEADFPGRSAEKLGELEEELERLLSALRERY